MNKKKPNKKNYLIFKMVKEENINSKGEKSLVLSKSLVHQMITESFILLLFKEQLITDL